jgi:hypothetical protein
MFPLIFIAGGRVMKWYLVAMAIHVGRSTLAEERPGSPTTSGIDNYVEAECEPF